MEKTDMIDNDNKIISKWWRDCQMGFFFIVVLKTKTLLDFLFTILKYSFMSLIMAPLHILINVLKSLINPSYM